MTIMHSRPFQFSRSDVRNVLLWLAVTAGSAAIGWLAEHSMPELREWSGIKALTVTVAVAVGRTGFLWLRDNRR